jgi:hypothetical protein
VETQQARYGVGEGGQRLWGGRGIHLTTIFFADQVLAAAILDRLLHFSTTISIRGQSYRLREKRKAGVFTDLADHHRESRRQMEQLS